MLTALLALAKTIRDGNVAVAVAVAVAEAWISANKSGNRTVGSSTRQGIAFLRSTYWESGQ